MPGNGGSGNSSMISNNNNGGGRASGSGPMMMGTGMQSPSLQLINVQNLLMMNANAGGGNGTPQNNPIMNQQAAGNAYLN
jgi:hypothetical protein